jgi:hypothetical protein
MNMNSLNLTKAQIIHIVVGVVSFLVWIGLLIASRFVTDGAGFLSTFADIIALAKTTTMGAVAIATAVGNFMPNQTAVVTTDLKDEPVTGVQSGQGGFIQVRLLALLAALSLGGLVACSSISGPQATTQSAQVAYVQACAGYAAAFSAALQAREAGKLNGSQIDQITLIDQQVTPVCTGPLPADPTVATQQVTAAVTTLTILGIVDHTILKK